MAGVEAGVAVVSGDQAVTRGRLGARGTAGVGVIIARIVALAILLMSPVPLKNPFRHAVAGNTVGVHQTVEVCDNQGLDAEVVRDFSFLDTLDRS